MAVHVLAVLAYKEGDRVTSALLAASINTNPVIVRRLLLALQRAKLVETGKGAGSGSRLSRSRAFCHPFAKTQHGVPGGPLHPADTGQGFCVGGVRLGTGPGEDHPGRCDHRGSGLGKLHAKKRPLTRCSSVE
jgi:hypothetical protein